MTDAQAYVQDWLFNGAEGMAQNMLLPFLLAVALLRVVLLAVLPPKVHNRM